MSDPCEAALGTTAESRITEEIIGLERKRVKAYTNRDIAALEQLLPHDFTFTRAVGSFGKRELIAMLESGDITFESSAREYDAVKIYGNSALANGQDMVKGRYRNQEFSGHFRFSNMYVCNDGRWQVVATHATRMSD
jgi:hypothetical protein